MTAATLHVAAPTRAEGVLLRFAERLAAAVRGRMERRAERRALAADLLREQQARRADPTAVDRALLLIGSRPR
ncbi:hypothetical protein J2Y69_003030 [Microbacterium resistens]|uniref:Uncharacterized protein n=1 Tax=Microbacterium resistens TaxID=156977 RepID=A0ABU1SFS2_9MICO|nr:hypothetical protein [Microbacterium resistens]MDR6868414.1 hypothetical protein [Microbacterium resistens]